MTETAWDWTRFIFVVVIAAIFIALVVAAIFENTKAGRHIIKVLGLDEENDDER